MLRLHVTAADFNCVQFILADTAIHEFLFAGVAIKKPLSSFFSQVARGTASRLHPPTQMRDCRSSDRRRHASSAALRGEISGAFPVLSKFAAEYNVLAVWPKDFGQRNYVKLAGRVDKRIRGLLRSVKCPGHGGGGRNCFRTGLVLSKQCGQE
jgi:hypothetical protein